MCSGVGPCVSSRESLHEASALNLKEHGQIRAELQPETRSELTIYFVLCMVSHKTVARMSITLCGRRKMGIKISQHLEFSTIG